MNYPQIFNIPEICAQLGVTHAIISPGSRNAPLTIAFARNEAIACKVIPDERSAAFIALGMAQQTNKPVVLICTSGSAALNYSPAVAEAYFQQIPLLIFTADRPPEWIDQLDGQTIRQENIYGKHVKGSYNMPVDSINDDASWHGQRMISEAVNLSYEFPCGPVHVNFPFREPLYPNTEAEVKAEVKVIAQTSPIPLFDAHTKDELAIQWRSYSRKLIIYGQAAPSKRELDLLGQLTKEQKIPIVGDIISNIQSATDVILHSDVFLGSAKKGLHESLQPDLLVTFGKSMLSKNLKLMLRKYKPKAHWHIQQAGQVADTYQSLTKVIRTSPQNFLEEIAQIENDYNFDDQKQENYFHIWQIEERKVKRLLSNFFPQEPLGEFELVKEVLDNLPGNCNLHLANSMSVRYANFIGLEDNKQINVYANRGTSGIDGCNSTTVGASLANDKLNVLITGDLAFLYDRNAFWHNYPIPNLRIVVLNNHAGGIFRIIKGPDALPELETYFETEQKLTASNVADEFNMDYFLCNKRSKLKNFMKQFFELDGKPKILELESDSKENKRILEDFKAAFNELK
ncbi:MAG TPA: 2-succinyl-5-enolpyruvyl-6-hydroxy-3-cyclohexene-1-carboxylic-acid synthase [Fulvivirga sp.]|nr:2-succinyl-5-enolpyruvyl-6-hydroxy-3-cyclohexene-1-carboxylic-acid synthase [Fulvivirga sp.]